MEVKEAGGSYSPYGAGGRHRRAPFGPAFPGVGVAPTLVVARLPEYAVPPQQGACVRVCVCGTRMIDDRAGRTDPIRPLPPPPQNRRSRHLPAGAVPPAERRQQHQQRQRQQPTPPPP